MWWGRGYKWRGNQGGMGHRGGWGRSNARDCRRVCLFKRELFKGAPHLKACVLCPLKSVKKMKERQRTEEGRASDTCGLWGRVPFACHQPLNTGEGWYLQMPPSILAISFKRTALVALPSIQYLSWCKEKMRGSLSYKLVKVPCQVQNKQFPNKINLKFN